MKAFRKLTENRSNFILVVSILWAAKFFSYLDLRVIYPLAPFLQDDWDISVDQMGIVLGLSELISIPVLLLAPCIDKYSPKRFTIASLFLSGFMTLLLVVDPTGFSDAFPYAFAMRILFMAAYQIFFCSSLGFIYTISNPGEAGMIIGFVETGWSIAAMAGIPLLALLYKRSGFQAVFGVVGGAVVLLAFLLYCCFRSSRKVQQTKAIDAKQVTSQYGIMEILRHFAHISVITFSLQSAFFMAAHNGTFAIFSYWVKDNFDIQVDDIGLPFFVLGVGELLGSIATSWVSYKQKHLIYPYLYITTILFGVGILILAWAQSYGLGLFCSFLIFSTGEFAFVLTISEATAYVREDYTSTIISVRTIFTQIGRSLGAFFAQKTYTTSGIEAAVGFLVGCTVASLLCLALAQKTKRQSLVNKNSDFQEKDTSASESSQGSDSDDKLLTEDNKQEIAHT